MNKALRFALLIPFLLIGIIALASTSTARPALAQACPTGASLPNITSVQPPAFYNGSNVTLTVTGSGFEEGAVVILNGFGVLTTTCVNSAVLSAVAPATLPGDPNGRLYTVRVVNPTNPGTNFDELADAVTVYQALPTPTPGPTNTPAPTAFVRPLLTVQSYGASSRELISYQDIDFEMTVQNQGQVAASNVTVIFTPGDLIPRATGGVVALGTITPGTANRFFQPFTTDQLSPPAATLDVTIKYTDPNGTEYSESFKLTFPVRRAAGAAGPTATPTPAVVNRPQLVIDSYEVDAEQLTPGTTFNLALVVHNLGTANATAITMIAGGGTINDGDTGTPTAGGVSGGSGEFTNFAPVGSSNVQFLGNLDAGGVLNPDLALVVNVTTNPGAYPFKVSFAYTGPDNRRYVDEQVVTLLVYSPVQVDVSFYRDPNPVFAGQPGPLPIQVINLSRSGRVFGNLEVTSENADLTNNTILVGLLDAGGFFTTDAVVTPYQPGPLELTVTINYSDDFNQPQTITRTLTLDVLESMPVDMPPEGEFPGGPPVPAQETFLQKLWRFIRGLLGLDSAPPSGDQFMPPFEGEPLPGEGGGGGGGVIVPVPLPAPPKG